MSLYRIVRTDRSRRSRAGVADDEHQSESDSPTPAHTQSPFQRRVKAPIEQTVAERGRHSLPMADALTSPPKDTCTDAPAWMRRSIGGRCRLTWDNLLG